MQGFGHMYQRSCLCFDVVRVPAVKNEGDFHWEYSARSAVSKEWWAIPSYVESRSRCWQWEKYWYFSCRCRQPCLDSLTCNEIELIIDHADCFIKNRTKSTTFHAAFFCNPAKSALSDLRRCMLCRPGHSNFLSAVHGCKVVRPDCFFPVGETLVR